MHDSPGRCEQRGAEMAWSRSSTHANAPTPDATLGLRTTEGAPKWLCRVQIVVGVVALAQG